MKIGLKSFLIATMVVCVLAFALIQNWVVPGPRAGILWCREHFAYPLFFWQVKDPADLPKTFRMKLEKEMQKQVDNNVVMVHLDFKLFEETDLNALRYFKNLDAVMVSYGKENSVEHLQIKEFPDLRVLSRIDSLRTVSIEAPIKVHSSRRNVFLDSLRKVRNLRINIRDQQTFLLLCQLERLQSLQISVNNVTDFEALRQLKNLNSLKIQFDDQQPKQEAEVDTELVNRIPAEVLAGLQELEVNGKIIEPRK